MSSIGYKSSDQEINKLITRLENIIREMESRMYKMQRRDK